MARERTCNDFTWQPKILRHNTHNVWRFPPVIFSVRLEGAGGASKTDACPITPVVSPRARLSEGLGDGDIRSLVWTDEQRTDDQQR